MLPEKSSRVKKNLPSIKVFPKPLDLIEIAFQDFPEYDTDKELYKAEWEAARRLKSAYLDLGHEPPFEMPTELWNSLMGSRHVPSGIDGDDFADAVEADWEKVKVPFGFTQICQVAEIRGTEREIPDELYRTPKTQKKAQKLLNLLMVLAETHQNGNFFCTSRQAGKFLGVPHKNASRVFTKLLKHKIILLVGYEKTHYGEMPIYHLGSAK